MENQVEDLGVKVGTMEQVIWEAVKKDTEKSIDDIEKALLIQRAILDMALEKIEIEKEKFK